MNQLKITLLIFFILFQLGYLSKGQNIPKNMVEKFKLGNVYTGLDVLMERNFDSLKGKRVGLITNHTGLCRDAISNIDIFHESEEFELVALLSPEHGIRGMADEKVESGIDSITGLPIHSLYGQHRKPTAEMLKNIDILVFNIQDIGTRFYTYIATMALSMQAAKEHNIKYIVLDRPNPIGGEKVEGAIPAPEQTGLFTSIYPIPTRHGMTIGELALLFNDYFGINCDLEVIPMRNWKRSMYYDQTGLLWVNPSPNMKTLNGAILYPGPGMSETTRLSPGRGTDRPFEMYGAPYINSEKLVANLNQRKIPGIRFVRYNFTPTALHHQFKDEHCYGVFAIITDRDKLNSTLAGLHLVQAIYETHPEEYREFGGFKIHTGDPNTWKMLTEKKWTPEQIIEHWQPALDRFLEIRKNFLLY